MKEIILIGFFNYVPKEKITGIYRIDTNPVREMVQRAKQTFQLVDATRGKKTKSVIVLENGVLVLSAIKPQTLAKRFVSDPISSLGLDGEE
jgi:extracellular matrix regulatory protein A